MVRPLTKKLYRDLAGMAGPAVTIALVVSLGIAGLIGFLGHHRDLTAARDRYYREYDYADLALTLRRAPRAAVEALAALPGVAALEARVSARVSLEFAGEARRVAGRMLSVPDSGPPAVNRCRLVAGRRPQAGGAFEVLLLDDFARARGLGAGDVLRVVVDQTTYELTVAGLVTNPEFVYVLPEDGGFVPEPTRFAVLWARRRLVEQLASMSGACNDVVARAGRGTDPAALRRLFEARLARYGVLLADLRADMTPYALLANELRLTYIRAWSVPGMFLLAATLVLHLVLTRLVAAQRVQIGTLKALGVSAPAILGHYLGFAVVICLGGAALGAWGGHHLTQRLLDLYTEFYHVPRGPPVFHADFAARGAAVALGTGFLGVADACRRVLKLTPAEAMRPAPPEARAAGFVPRLTALPFLWRWSLRGMVRHPFRTAVSVCGVMLAVVLMTTSRFFLEAMTMTNMFNFRVTQRQDVEVQLADGVSEAAAAEVGRLPGVTRVEVMLTYPFEVRAGRRSRRVLAEGFEPDATLRRPRDLAGKPVPLPREGVLLSESLAGALGVTPGRRVSLRALRGDRRRVDALVAGTYPTFLGRSLAARRDVLARLVGESRAGSVLSYAADRVDASQERALTRRPAVRRVTRRPEKIASFEENIQGVLEVANRIFVFLAGAIACGLLLNGALVGLAERRGELAVLRVQGFTRAEVGDLLLYEQLLTGAIGGALGVPGAYVLIGWIHSRVQTEIIRVPFVISRWGLARAQLYALGFLVVAHLALRLLLRRQDWRADLAVKE